MTRSLTLALAVLLALAAACSSSAPVAAPMTPAPGCPETGTTIATPTDLPLEMEVAVRNAAGRWNAELKDEYLFYFCAGGEWRVVSDPTLATNGYFDRQITTVWLHPQGRLEVAAVHELGHVLGLWHTESGVMCGDLRDGSIPEGCASNESPEITDADRAECRRMRPCP